TRISLVRAFSAGAAGLAEKYCLHGTLAQDALGSRTNGSHTYGRVRVPGSAAPIPPSSHAQTRRAHTPSDERVASGRHTETDHSPGGLDRPSRSNTRAGSVSPCAGTAFQRPCAASFLRGRHPPLEHHTARARHREHVAVPSGLGRIAGH